MKRVYLIHGWGGNSEGGWFDWLKIELSKKNFKVEAFDMPETEKPTIENWVGYLEKKIDSEELDEETFFIGHSIGCQTILRYLEKIPKHKKIGGCVFVAGWFKLINLSPEEMQVAHPWTSGDINFERVLQHTDNFLAIFSNDDPLVALEEKDVFEKELGAKIIVKKNCGHFNQIQEISEILEFVK
jgi:uncharacterized protein